MKKKTLLIGLIILLNISNVMSQTSAGKCWNIDYQLWNINTPALHVLCGNDDAFNVGNELTLEMWIRAYTFGENRKIMGKIDSDGSVFNNGYVMGFQNLNVYTEVWNPSLQQISYPGAGPIPLDSAFVHLVSTYSSTTGLLSDYINGELAGQIQVFPANPLASNNAPFIFGAAPWGDYSSFQFYGAIDEIRVWNVARTQEEIKSYMFKELAGNEQGLVAYYNFNTAHDFVVPDMSIHGFDGALQNGNDPCWSWADSYVPVGNAEMYNLIEPVAAWCGKSPVDFNYALTENGLSVITDIQEKEFNKYLVFALKNGAGTTIDNIPANAPADFKRLSREWYLNQGGNVGGDLFIDLVQAANGGEQIPGSAEANLYVLMHKTSLDADYTPIAYASTVFNNNLIFNDLVFQDGYYCLGYSTTVLPLSINEVMFNNVLVSPNPASNFLSVKGGKGMTVTLLDLTGRLMLKQLLVSDNQKIDLSDMASGTYFIRMQMEHLISTRKIIIQ
ncbi:MAG: T9SS type A sorting domain-containing protein [Lentimicrobium sp.]|nr:T9SS type A sorting domain-containing protein [Lentimicrobium sp.]